MQIIINNLFIHFSFNKWLNKTAEIEKILLGIRVMITSKLEK